MVENGIQHKVLKWAREKAGYKIEDIAAVFKKDISEIEAWETGDSSPTYIQLEKLAYQIYKRPIAIFFFPNPPEEADIKKSFRTLPDSDMDSLWSDTRFALRYAKGMQLSLAELVGERNPAKKCIFDQIKLSVGSNPNKVASEVRKYLGVSLDAQLKFKSPEEALKVWREKIEDVGVFVFKRSFKQESISGFCLFDDQYPIIYLNNGNADSRQIFSLFHELAHILFHINGISLIDEQYIDYLQDKERKIEQLCNQFAGEVLVPSADFDKQITVLTQFDDRAIGRLAVRYKVSREVILRKLLDRGKVNKEYYLSKSSQWNKEFFEAKENKRQGKAGGGDYYKTQAAYLGEKYLEVVFKKYYQGRLNIQEVADYLGVKVRSIAGLEQLLMNKKVTA